MASCAACAAAVHLEDTLCPQCGAPLVDPFIGQVIGERYRIVDRIGIGGMGVVYRAEHTMMRRELAIKVLLPELSGKEEFARRFEREAESASRLHHPNIITVTDFGHTADGSLFLVMELLSGPSLSAAIAKGPMPPDRALAIERQILRALDHAHGAGVVHRDLKPENIMLIERDGQTDFVKILDFGIAKVTEPQTGGSGREALTQAGVIFGTPEYLSPEQALGEAVDPRADIYAAGVILFEMLTGRRPFESEDKVKIISMHLAHAPPRIMDVNPNVQVPLPLEQAILQALEKSRENRFATAAAFMQALDDAEAQSAAEAEIEKTLPHMQLPLPPRRRAPVVVASLVAVLGVGTWAVRHHRAARHHPASLAVTPPRPAPPPPDLAAEMKKVESWLESGDTPAARRSLETLLSARPKDARVRYMLGRVAYDEDKHKEALDDYGQAIALDPGFRGDPVLLGHLDEMLSEPKLADAALDLAVDHIGAPAADVLAKAANEGSDLPRRRRAAGALNDLGDGKRVDRVSLGMLELRKADDCEGRKAWVGKLRELGDPRALPALRGLRPKRVGPISWGGADVKCMKTELPEAIAELEKKSGHTEPPHRNRRGR